MPPQVPRKARKILETTNKAEGLIFPDFKIYSKVTVINTVWYWRRIDV